MLIDDIKAQMFAAMKAKAIVKKEILRTVIGEVTATGEDATDERVQKAIRKMLKSNQETQNAVVDETQRAELIEEAEILNAYLPKALSVQQLITELSPVCDAIRAANNDGQATGVAVKHLKTTGAEFDGKDVAAAVKQLRT